MYLYLVYTFSCFFFCMCVYVCVCVPFLFILLYDFFLIVCMCASGFCLLFTRSLTKKKKRWKQLNNFTWCVVVCWRDNNYIVTTTIKTFTDGILLFRLLRVRKRWLISIVTKYSCNIVIIILLRYTRVGEFRVYFSKNKRTVFKFLKLI